MDGCKKVFANHIYAKELILEIYKERIQLNSKNQRIQCKKWAKDLNRLFPKEDTQMADKYAERCQRHSPQGSHELSPGSGRNGDPQKDEREEVRARTRGTGSPGAVSVGMQIGAATVENSTETPRKIKNRRSTSCSRPTCGYLREGHDVTGSERRPRPRLRAASLPMATTRKQATCPGCTAG